MTENDVVDEVERAFANRGFALVGKCSTTKRGVDLHIRHKDTGSEWLIEAKGQTSANARSPRFGKPFTASQIGVHVAKAIHQAMTLRANNSGKHIGIALPDDERHNHEIACVGNALQVLRIAVIWVKPDGTAALPDEI